MLLGSALLARHPASFDAVVVADDIAVVASVRLHKNHYECVCESEHVDLGIENAEDELATHVAPNMQRMRDRTIDNERDGY